MFAAAIASFALAPTAFAAGPEACGNISLSSISECHFEFEGGCKAKCEPLSFVAACDGQCNASIDASCDTSCQGSCQAACEVEPAQFDCRASCYGDCSANIAVLCDPGDDECISYCEADCSASCETECEFVAPSASCDAQCNACCTGSCDVDANFECSLDCSASLDGGCEVDCDAPAGALFCDGQYIAVQDLPECVAYLVENFSVNLSLEASASASVNGAMCSFGDGRSGDGGIALLMAGLGLAFWRRRRSAIS
jgi:hypothetical protein